MPARGTTKKSSRESALVFRGCTEIYICIYICIHTHTYYILGLYRAEKTLCKLVYRFEYKDIVEKLCDMFVVAVVFCKIQRNRAEQGLRPQMIL